MPKTLPEAFRNVAGVRECRENKTRRCLRISFSESQLISKILLIFAVKCSFFLGLGEQMPASTAASQGCVGLEISLGFGMAQPFYGAGSSAPFSHSHEELRMKNLLCQIFSLAPPRAGGCCSKRGWIPAINERRKFYAE